jgi:RHS repeat-associated protein
MKYKYIYLLGILLLLTLKVSAQDIKTVASGSNEVEFSDFSKYSGSLGSASNIMLGNGYAQYLESTCLTKKVKEAWLFVEISLEGDNGYRLGTSGHTFSIEADVQGYDASGTRTFSKYFLFEDVDYTNPKLMYRIDFSDYVEETYYIYINNLAIYSYSPSTILDNITLKAYLDVSFGMDVSGLDLVTINSMGSTPITGSSVSLSWNTTTPCEEEIQNYEVQVLRLYNNYDGNADDPEFLSATIDWSEALSIETESPETEITLTLAERTGYYMWRVRAIGNYYDEGNADNYGNFTDALTDDDNVGMGMLSDMYDFMFYYEQFDSDKNFIYNRTFSEGDDESGLKVAEGISYADGLFRVRQTQRKLNELDEQTLMNATMYDYVGRPAINSMTAPVTQSGLGYHSNLLQDDNGSLYSPLDFDESRDGQYLSEKYYYTAPTLDETNNTWSDFNSKYYYYTYTHPDPAFGPISDYYSDENEDINVPNAGTYPYSRTLYHNDSRVKKQTLFGDEHWLGLYDKEYIEGSGLQRTIRTYYSAVADTELLKVFGNQSPADTSVYKIVRVDPNAMSTVEYKSYDGKTLATCLINTGDHPLLKDIHESKIWYTKKFEKDKKLNEYALSNEEVMNFTDPDMQITLDYKLGINEFSASCVDFCSTCDYQIYFYIIQEETGYTIWDDMVSLIPYACGEDSIYKFTLDNEPTASTTETGDECIPVGSAAEDQANLAVLNISDPGNYRIGRIITINSSVEGGGRFSDEIQDTIGEIMDTILSAYDPLFYELDSFGLDSLYAYLDSVDVTCAFMIDEDAYYANNNLWVYYDESVGDFGEYSVQTECCQVTFPKIPCDWSPCEDLWIPTYTKSTKGNLWNHITSNNHNETLCEMFKDQHGYYDFEQMLFDANDDSDEKLYKYFRDRWGNYKHEVSFSTEADIHVSTPGYEYDWIMSKSCTVDGEDVTYTPDEYDDLYCGTSSASDPCGEEYLNSTLIYKKKYPEKSWPTLIFSLNINDAFLINETITPDVLGLTPTEADICMGGYSWGCQQCYVTSTIILEDYMNALDNYLDNELTGYGHAYLTEINTGSYYSLTIVLDELDNDLYSPIISITPSYVNATITREFSPLVENPDDSEFEYGTGGFNAMINHMLLEEDEKGNPIYDCYDLYNCWAMIVANWETNKDIIGTEATAGGYDMLEDFLACSGTMYYGFSDHPYGEGDANDYLNTGLSSTDDNFGYGYLEYAYKTFEFDMAELDALYLDDPSTYFDKYQHVSKCMGTWGMDISDPVSTWDAPEAWEKTYYDYDEDGNVVSSYTWDLTTIDQNSWDQDNTTEPDSLASWMQLKMCVQTDFSSDVQAFSLDLSDCGDNPDESCLDQLAGKTEYYINHMLYSRENSLYNQSKATFKEKGWYQSNDNKRAFIATYNSTQSVSELASQIEALDFSSSEKGILPGREAQQKVIRIVSHAFEVESQENGSSRTSILSADDTDNDNTIAFEKATVAKSKIMEQYLEFQGNKYIKLNKDLDQEEIEDEWLQSFGNRTGWSAVSVKEFNGTVGKDADGKRIYKHPQSLTPTCITKCFDSSSDKELADLDQYTLKACAKNGSNQRIELYLEYNNYADNGSDGILYYDPIAIWIDYTSETDEDLTYPETANRLKDSRDLVASIKFRELVQDKKQECDERNITYLKNLISDGMNVCRQNEIDSTLANYKTYCAGPPNIEDTMIIRYQLDYHQYTLFYYDLAGNLIKVIPPKGVDEFEWITDKDGNIDRSVRGNYPTRADAKQHSHATVYAYNSLGQRVFKYTPDGGKTQYWHNSMGQLRFSQNEKQLANGTFSYLKYDALGRIVEAGESDDNCGSYYNGGWVYFTDDNTCPSTGTNRVFTVYSEPSGVDFKIGYDEDDYYQEEQSAEDVHTFEQEFIQNRVSYTYLDSDGTDGSGDEVYTYYSYNPHGNVEWMIQSIPGLDKKYIAYEYDLYSGKVTKIKYNQGYTDQFFHRYAYDSDNRIQKVETSRDGVIWETDAQYEYYAFGPMKRLSIGNDNIQGLDHVWTINGWLKGLNHQSLESEYDPGEDGGLNSSFAKDAFGMTLGYFDGDFKRAYNSDGDKDFDENDDYSVFNSVFTDKPCRYTDESGNEGYIIDQGGDCSDIDGNVEEGNYYYDYNAQRKRYQNTGTQQADWLRCANLQFTSGLDQSKDRLEYFQLFDGTITNWVYNSAAIDGSLQYDGKVKGFKYNYDELYRLVSSAFDYYDSDATSPGWQFTADLKDYNTFYEYDKMGNITSLKRYSYGNTQMDDLTYAYNYLNDNGDTTNMLSYIDDLVAASSFNDVDDQTSATNYEYDEIGQLVNDKSEGIKEIIWNVSNKIDTVYYKDKNKDGIYDKTIVFQYDALGNRIKKMLYENGTKTKVENYVHDAKGNVLAIYEYSKEGSTESRQLKEWPLYSASGRMGAIMPALDVSFSTNEVVSEFDNYYERKIGEKYYELEDHLGNVRVVVNDIKEIDDNADLDRDGVNDTVYVSNIISETDYYPFGMQMPGRSYEDDESTYRYGFQGKEKDDDVKGKGNSYDFGARVYDPRVSRWLSMDPLAEKFPHQSPYVAMDDNPVNLIDPDGNSSKEHAMHSTTTAVHWGHVTFDVIEMAANITANTDVTITVTNLYTETPEFSRSFTALTTLTRESGLGHAMHYMAPAANGIAATGYVMEAGLYLGQAADAMDGTIPLGLHNVEGGFLLMSGAGLYLSATGAGAAFGVPLLAAGGVGTMLTKHVIEDLQRKHEAFMAELYRSNVDLAVVLKNQEIIRQNTATIKEDIKAHYQPIINEAEKELIKARAIFYQKARYGDPSANTAEKRIGEAALNLKTIEEQLESDLNGVDALMYEGLKKAASGDE